MLNIGGSSPSSARRDSGTGPGSRSGSVPRRRSGELIAPIGEEDEDEVEEVESFSPVLGDAEETLVEGREQGMPGCGNNNGGP